MRYRSLAARVDQVVKAGAEQRAERAAGPEARRSGIGLRNTRDRLRHLYGPLPGAGHGSAPGRTLAGGPPAGERLTFDEPPGGGVRVTLRLPWRTGAVTGPTAATAAVPAR